MWVQKIGIPTYFHRGANGQDDWARAVTAGPDLGITVINPASGPGYTPSFQPGGAEHNLCRQRIQAMHDAGAWVLGYVTTNYRDQRQTSVQREHRFTVDPATDVVTTRNAEGTEKETGWSTGFGPVHVDSASTLPGGLATGTDYFWIELSPHTGHFAASPADAVNNTPVDVNSPGDRGPTNDNHFTGLSRTFANLKNVTFEIDEYYRRWPEIDGIFFDEMDNRDPDNPDNPELLPYYQQIKDHFKTKPGRALVVQNPGTTFPESMVDVADVFMSFESTAAAYQERVLAWEGSYAAEKFWHAIHSCSEVDEMNNMIDRSRALNAGYVYVTDRAAPNPWEHIATYFEQETQAVRAGNSPS